MAGTIEWWPVSKITLDPSGPYVQVFKDYWWVLNELGEVAMWRGPRGRISPQCNAHRAIAEKTRAHLRGYTVRQIPLAFSPIRLGDYE